MERIRTDDGMTIHLKANEFNSLALFLAQFTTDDIVKTIGHTDGVVVDNIADQMSNIWSNE